MKSITKESAISQYSAADSLRRIGLMLAFGSVLLNGTYSALAKGLTAYLSPVSLLLASEGLTALFIALTIGAVPLIRALFSLTGKEFAMALLVGLLNSGVAPFLWFSGLKYTTAINASILSGSDIIFTLLFSVWLLSERINREQGVGMFTVLLGIIIINVATTEQTFSIHIGDLLVICGTATFALGAVLFKKYLTHMSAEVAIFVRNISGMLAVLLVSSFFTSPFVSEFTAFPVQKIVLLVSFAFFARYLHLTLFYEALDRLPATELGLMDNATPLAGIFFAVLLLGESLHFYQMIGAALIVCGLAVEHISKDAIVHVRQHLLHFGASHS